MHIVTTPYFSLRRRSSRMMWPVSREPVIRLREPGPGLDSLPGDLHPVIRRILASRGITSIDDTDLALGRMEVPDSLLEIDKAAGLLSDAGGSAWIVAALSIPGIILAVSKAYALWGRDEHDPLRLRRGLVLILVLGGLVAATGLALWWLGLRWVASAAAATPGTGLRHLVDWLTAGSALVVLSFQAAVLLGILWLILAGRIARVERAEAELLLLEELG